MENRDDIIALNHEGRKALKKSAFDLIYSNAGLFCLAGFFYCVIIAFLRIANDHLGSSNNLSIHLSAATSIGNSLLQIFLLIVMMLITTSFVMGIYRATKLGEKNDLARDSAGHLLFGAFNNQNLTSTVSVGLLKFAYLLGWYMLLIIPGMVKQYAYVLSPYVMADSIDRGKPVSASEAIRKSEELMKGHKLDFFILHLSLLGWYLLGVITLGIGFVFVHPFSAAITAKFYEALTTNKHEDDSTAVADTTSDNLDLFDNNGDDDLFADDNEGNEEKSEDIDINDALLDDNDFKDLDDLAKYQKEHENNHTDSDQAYVDDDFGLDDEPDYSNFGLGNTRLGEDEGPIPDLDPSQDTFNKSDKHEKDSQKSDKDVDNTNSEE